MKTFPMLYKKASTGKMLSWQISVDGATISETWGQIEGKMQSTSDVIREGKNIGKKNETTAEQQALAEAESKWTKKLKSHNYTEVMEDAAAGRSSDLVEGGLLPMLAHKYRDYAHKILYPCYLQPKLDGHRIVAVPEAGCGVRLWSRNRRLKDAWPHITARIKAMWSAASQTPFPLDGEGYNNDYRKDFETLTHFLQQEEYIPGSEIVQYHIYDCIIEGLPFKARHERLASILANEPADSPLKLVETIEVKDEDEMMIAFEHFLALGYEGVMVRNAAGLYVPKRSYDLQKVKKFDDDEFIIHGVVEGRGKLAGHAVFSCNTHDGVSFEAKLVGDQKKLKEYWDHPEKVIGRKLTVKYQGFFKSGKLRFAVAHRLHETI